LANVTSTTYLKYYALRKIMTSSKNIYNYVRTKQGNTKRRLECQSRTRTHFKIQMSQSSYTVFS